MHTTSSNVSCKEAYYSMCDDMLRHKLYCSLIMTAILESTFLALNIHLPPRLLLLSLINNNPVVFYQMYKVDTHILFVAFHTVFIAQT